MNLKCRFLGHRWSRWGKVDGHLEKECSRCGTVLAKYPPWTSVLMEGLVEIAEFYLMAEKWGFNGAFQGRERPPFHGRRITE